MLCNDLLRKVASAKTSLSCWIWPGVLSLHDLNKRQDRILDAARVLQMEGVKVPRVSGVVGATSSDA
eukprot:scaffold659102_cov73-Prasinocladus_malaysianus.AAC.1